jgi:hypothetical protein
VNERTITAEIRINSLEHNEQTTKIHSTVQTTRTFGSRKNFQQMIKLERSLSLICGGQKKKELRKSV